MHASASQQITERGDGNIFNSDLTIGANFDDGKGNAVVSLGYQEADALYQGDRDVSLFTIGSTSGVASGASPTSVPTGVDFGAGQLQLNPSSTALVSAYAPFNFSRTTSSNAVQALQHVRSCALRDLGQPRSL